MPAAFARCIFGCLGLLALVATVGASPDADAVYPSSHAPGSAPTTKTSPITPEVQPLVKHGSTSCIRSYWERPSRLWAPAYECKGVALTKGSYWERPSRLWARTEYLVWWTCGNRLPPLLSTSPDGTSRQDAGVLGLSDTTTVFGGRRVDENERPGGRLHVGYRLDPCGVCSLETDLIAMGDGANTNFASLMSTGSPILARPIINTDTGLEDSQLVAFPNLVDGQFGVDTSSELYSAAVLLRKRWLASSHARWDLLAGYRFFRFGEGLRIRENLISRQPGPVILPGTLIDVFDEFHTANSFHGGEMGLELVLDRGIWSVDLLAKVALGNTRQRTEINGLTRVTLPAGTPVNRPGGLLALPSNIGSYTHDRFAVLPELGANIQCKLTERLHTTFGYTWLLLTDVVRSGDQIDRQIDPSQLSPFLNVAGNATSAARPAVPFHTSAFWAHGVSVGLEFDY